MKVTKRLSSVATVAVLAAYGATAQAQQASMSFFVTSSGVGKGADLSGLEGADRHCQQLAQTAGAGNRTWRAYLSTQGADGHPAVNARDRIGRGPWQNAKGVIIAKDVDELHGNNQVHGRQLKSPVLQPSKSARVHIFGRVRPVAAPYFSAGGRNE